MKPSMLLQEISAQGVLTITLNQAEKRNALSEEMLNQLFTALKDAKKNQKVRVLVLAAVGPVFCAGHDLKELTTARKNQDGGKEFFASLFKLCSKVMKAIVNHPKPVVAKVQGLATAAGCQLVASCDLAVANSEAKFATPGVHIGLFCSTPMVALSRNILPKQAMEMLLTGNPISSEKALNIGLINKITSAETLSQEVQELANQIAAKSTTTVAIGKKAFYQQLTMNLDNAYQYTSEVMAKNMLKQDAKEGINAFIEKRPASWEDQ